MTPDRPEPPVSPTVAGPQPWSPQPWSPEPWSPAPVPGAGPVRRVPRWFVVVAAATAVAAVAAFGAVVLWPGGSDRPGDPGDPLAFHRFASVGRVGFDQPSRTAFTAVLGDRGYTAWQREGGELRVVAFELATGTPVWQQAVRGADGWSRIHPAAAGLLVFGYEPDPTAQRRMFVLDRETGRQRWHLDVRGDDHLFLRDGTLTWLDRERERLQGLDPDSGDERWRQEVPDAGDVTVLPVLSEPDLARPADLRGNPGPGEGDGRLVLVDPDRSVRVVDSRDGRVRSEGRNIADPDDRLLAYRGRLFVAPDELGYQLTSYDLGELAGGVPRVHYAAGDPDRYPELLEPCGERVCLLENLRFDRETTELVVVDVTEDGARWRAPAPRAEQVLGVGEWVAVATDVDFQPSVVVHDAGGQPVLEQAGVAVRLDSGNLLVLAGLGGTGGVDVSGIATGGAGDPVALGRLPEETVTRQCSWTDRYLACPDRTGTEIWQFAED